MINSVSFAERLQKVLDYYGLSASAFADAIEVNRSSISHLLSGRNKPSLEFVLKVLEKYPEVKLYWLLNGKGTFPATEPMENDTPTLFPEESSSVVETAADNSDTKSKAAAIHSESEQLPDNLDKIVFFYKDGTFKVFQNHK
jgi:transcriptional regulator with XRE-family HTH domain